MSMAITQWMGREIRSHTSYRLGTLPNPLRLKTDTPFGAKDCARIHPRSHGQKEAPKIRINRDFYRIITQHNRAHPSLQLAISSDWGCEGVLVMTIGQQNNQVQ